MMSDGEKFESLLPQKNVDLSSYKDALDHAMDSDEIRNIALSGSYGSGKSSVIRSYEGVNKDRRFLHISLAHFEEVNREFIETTIGEGKKKLKEGPKGTDEARRQGNKCLKPRKRFKRKAEISLICWKEKS